MKRISKIMVVLMLSVMLIGTATMTTLGATTYTAIGGSTTFTQNLVVDENATIPDVTFAYTIAPGTAASASASTIEILISSTDASVGTAEFTSSDTASATAGLPTDAAGSPTAGKKYASKSVTVSFPDGSFTKPGVYRYVITATNNAEPGVTYDANATRYVDVFVVADPTTNELSVDSYTLRDTATDIGTDGEYSSNPGEKSSGYTNTVTQYDFDFSKAITGNQGDKNKRFEFTLNITNAIPGTYTLETNDVTGDPTTITVGSDGTYTGTYSLTNGSTLKVLELNQSAVCRVSENSEDYVASHTVDGGAAVSAADSGNLTLTDDDRSVAFTNTRDGIIPTGVLLTIAPFTIGLFLFGAIIVFVMAKRRRVAY